MDTNANSAVRLRRLELLVLGVGIVATLIVLGLGTKGAFRANMAGGHELTGFLLTCYSIVVMGAVLVAPFVLVAFLGRKIKPDGQAGSYQVIGFFVSLLVTCAAIYLYIDAHNVVSHDRSSTAGLVFIAVAIYLCMGGGVLYGIVALLYSRSRKRSNA